MNKKYYLKDTVTSKDLKLIGKDNILIYNNSSVSISDEYQKVNANLYREEGGWFAWRYNEKSIQQYQSKLHSFLEIEKINLKNVAKKYLYWSNARTGNLYAFLEKNQINPREIIHIDSMFAGKVWKKWIQNLSNALSFKRNNNPNSQLDFSCKNKIAFYIKDSFELSLYWDIILYLGGKKCFVFTATPDLILETDIKKLQEQWIEFKVVHLSKASKGNMEVPFGKREFWLIKDLIKKRSAYWNAWYLFLQEFRDLGIPCLVVNAEENDDTGVLFCRILQPWGIRVVNAMNGTKAGHSSDTGVEFDQWIVWDDTMKKLLIEKAKVPESMLKVVGHFHEDKIIEYTYSGSYNGVLNQNNFERIISVYGVNDNRPEKSYLALWLKKYLKENRNTLVLYRRHPSDKDDLIARQLQELENFYAIDFNLENGNIKLYDQIAIGDVAVCFGSTTALQTNWRGKPAITFEESENSLLHTVDNNLLFHARNIQELEKYLAAALKMECHSRAAKNITKKYAEIIEFGEIRTA